MFSALCREWLDRKPIRSAKLQGTIIDLENRSLNIKKSPIRATLPSTADFPTRGYHPASPLRCPSTIAPSNIRSFLENCRTSQFDFCTGLFSHAGSFLITTTVRGQHPRSNHQHPNASGGKVILNLDTFVRGSDRSRLNLSMDGYCEVRK